MVDEEKPTKAKRPEGASPTARPKPEKKESAEEKDRARAAEAEASVSEEEEEAADAVEGRDDGDNGAGAEAEEPEEDEPEEERPPTRKRGGRRRLRRSTADEEEGEEGARKRSPRPRPELSAEVKLALEQRKEISARRPAFRRQEWFRYQRLGDAWRAPHGIQSKQRRHWKNHPDLVSIGFRGPRKARGLHPSGFREILIQNEKALAEVDRKTEAVRIAAAVGGRTREAIQRKARKMGIRVLNWR
jgi:large subunit ribosomal protein L32e